jgi:hypothetical protein
MTRVLATACPSNNIIARSATLTRPLPVDISSAAKNFQIDCKIIKVLVYNLKFTMEYFSWRLEYLKRDIHAALKNSYYRKVIFNYTKFIEKNLTTVGFRIIFAFNE